MTAYEYYHNLQKTIQKTGTNLDSFSSTLKNVEKCLSTPQLEETDSESVLEVLETMSEVKNEYMHLRQDLQEVQQLQKEMATTLQFQLRSMTQTYNILKKRIESTTSLPPVALPQKPFALERPRTAPPVPVRTVSSLSSSSLPSN